MRIKLITIGLTGTGYLSEGLKDYEQRLQRYVGYERIDIPLPKPGAADPREKEGDLLLSKLNDGDVVVLLDENGEEYTSVEFAAFLQKRMNAGTRQLVFLIGGAFGFSEKVKQRGNHVLSLSRMTLTHQMVRLFFTEQLYRGFTIIKGEKYHHQ